MHEPCVSGWIVVCDSFPVSRATGERLLAKSEFSRFENLLHELHYAGPMNRVRHRPARQVERRSTRMVVVQSGFVYGRPLSKCRIVCLGKSFLSTVDPPTPPPGLPRLAWRRSAGFPCSTTTSPRHSRRHSSTRVFSMNCCSVGGGVELRTRLFRGDESRSPPRLLIYNPPAWLSVAGWSCRLCEGSARERRALSNQ